MTGLEEGAHDHYFPVTVAVQRMKALDIDLLG